MLSDKTKKVLQTTGIVSGTSKELLGYDFVGLLGKLVVYYIVAFFIAKYLEFVSGTANFIQYLFPGAGNLWVPQSFIDFYTTGYNGIKFWDVVKGFSIFLVFIEHERYVLAQKQLGATPSAMTQGIFAMIMIFLALITVPELYRRFKDRYALANGSGSSSVTAGDALRGFFGGLFG